MHQEKGKQWLRKKEHKTIDQILDLSETVDNDLYKQFEDIEDMGGIPGVSEEEKDGIIIDSVKHKPDNSKKIKSDADTSESEKLERSRIPIYVRTLVRVDIISKHRGIPRIEILSRLVDAEYDKIKKELYGKLI